MIEFRVDNNEPIEVSDRHQELSAKGRERFILDGERAFSIWRGKVRERLIAQYEIQQKMKPAAVITAEPLRKTLEEPVAPIKAEVLEPVITPAASAVVEEAVAIDGQGWVPDYRDWFDCALKFRLPNAFAVVGELSNGDEIFIHEREFTVRAGGGHTLCLPGAKVAVRMEINPSNHRYRYRALECQFLGETTEYKTHAIGTVLSWTGSLGGCRMDCSCSILIGTASRDEQMSLDEGDRIEFDIVFKEKIQKWIGTNITVLESRPKE